MINIDKYETIILDCDGIIFDSNMLKLTALRSVLTDFAFDPDVVASFMDYFENNFGISRYNLIRTFIKDFLRIEFRHDIYSSILEKFSSNCLQLYQSADFTDFFIDFMEAYSHKTFFVASGSDQEELRSVFRLRGIDRFFVDILGSPMAKSDIIKRIMIQDCSAVLIGDAKVDMQAAIDSNIDFIFMYQYSTSDEMMLSHHQFSIQNLGDLL